MTESFRLQKSSKTKSNIASLNHIYRSVKYLQQQQLYHLPRQAVPMPNPPSVGLLILNLSLPQYHLRQFPRIQSLITQERKPASLLLQPPFRQLHWAVSCETSPQPPLLRLNHQLLQPSAPSKITVKNVDVFLHWRASAYVDGQIGIYKDNLIYQQTFLFNRVTEEKKEPKACCQAWVVYSFVTSCIISIMWKGQTIREQKINPFTRQPNSVTEPDV